LRNRRTTSTPPEILFVYNFDLLIDYLAGEAIDRYVYPVMLFAFDKEACETVRARGIAAALSYHIMYQIPR
jgi:hypothetical protein